MMRRQPSVSTRSPFARLFAIAFAVLTLSPCDGMAAVNWDTSVEGGSAAALKANKPMLLEFWANWCPPCLVMDAEVYTNASVIQAMTKVVPVRIDVDKQPLIARKYELTGMPMLVFADSYGNELFRFTGTITAPTMIQLLEEFPGDVTSVNRLARVLAKDKDNFAALESLGRELKAAGLFSLEQHVLRESHPRSHRAGTGGRAR